MRNAESEVDSAEHLPAAVRRGTGGRPTREAAARRDERLIEVATNLFMERGFEGTSIDAVAEAAGVSKPTVYARYHDKGELFAAVLRGRIERWLAPLSAAAEAHAHEVGSKGIEATLHDLSRGMLALTLTPGAISLRRILAAQAMRFPELATLARQEGWQRAVRAIATLLQKFAAGGEISVHDPELAADLFLSLVLAGSGRLADYGIAIDPEVQERRRQAAVELFLNGVRTR
jgi:TetR/AcrR family transcriptional repressor of mexJK operon